MCSRSGDPSPALPEPGVDPCVELRREKQGRSGIFVLLGLAGDDDRLLRSDPDLPNVWTGELGGVVSGEEAATGAVDVVRVDDEMESGGDEDVPACCSSGFRASALEVMFSKTPRRGVGAVKGPSPDRGPIMREVVGVTRSSSPALVPAPSGLSLAAS